MFLEIAAYWTPECIQTKSAKIDLFPDAPLLVAVLEEQAKKWPAIPSNVIMFKSALKLNAVADALERMAGVRV